MQKKQKNLMRKFNEKGALQAGVDVPAMALPFRDCSVPKKVVPLPNNGVNNGHLSALNTSRIEILKWFTAKVKFSQAPLLSDKSLKKKMFYINKNRSTLEI